MFSLTPKASLDHANVKILYSTGIKASILARAGPCIDRFLKGLGVSPLRRASIRANICWMFVLILPRGFMNVLDVLGERVWS